MLVNNLSVLEMQTEMYGRAEIAANEAGKKFSAGIRTMADAVGVDYATMKGFATGTTKKPAELTVDRVRAYLRDNGDCQSVVEDPRDAKISELEAKIRQLHEEIEYKDKNREDLRLSYVKVREQLESMQAQDPEFHEQYQVVHPENSYWMSHGDAFIEIYTTGRDWEDSAERNRVCTIPIPDTAMFLHRGQVPHIRVEKEDGSFDWISDPDYVKISESDKGEVWEKPETVTSQGYTIQAQSVVVESKEQFAVRREQVRAENFASIADAAKAIEKMYRKCGGIPDTEVYVGLRVDVCGNVF
jgi:hypothetical protein